MDSIKSAILANEIAKVFSIDSEIKNAISKIRREIFLPRALWAHAYALAPLPISNGQWISSPLSVAKMTQYLCLNGVDSVLEIGLGSGYQVFLLSKLVRRVFSIERIAEIYKQTHVRLVELNVHNITIKLDDGMLGWEQFAPFDRILLSACTQEIPDSIISQLSSSGIIVAPVDLSAGNLMDLDISKFKNDLIFNQTKQLIVRFIKDGSNLRSEALEACDFVPIVSGLQK